MCFIKDWKKYFPDFSPKEVLSPDGLAAFDKGILVVQPYALSLLQSLRNFTGPLYVNHDNHRRRGYRSYYENEDVGGAEYSFHMQGLAFDTTAKELTVDELSKAALAVGFTGIFVYRSSNFVHLDIGTRLSEEEPRIREIKEHD